MIEIIQHDTNLLHVRLSGKLTTSDYEYFGPAVEKIIEEHGKIRALVHMEDFHGWTAGALWQDVKFDAKHFNDLERIAFVGDKAWEKGMSVFCKPFTTAKVRYFDQSEREEALTWVQE